MTDGVFEPSSKRRKSNGVSHKEYERLQKMAYGGGSTSKDVVKQGDAPSYDPWASESSEEDHNPRLNFLEKPKPIRAPKTLKEAPISLIQGGLVYPAVPRPRAGASYNPMFEDYDKVLVQEGEKEVNAEKKRLREAELEQQRLDKIRQIQEEREDVHTEDESAWEGIESEYEGEAWLKKRRPERKTPVQRNKAKRRKEAERQAKWDSKMKKRAQQAQRITEIAHEVDSKEKARGVILATTEDPSQWQETDAPLRRRALGKSR